MRIVIVEDNESLARAIAYRLRSRGHSVDHLVDGAEAARFLQREGADLVILDINLPGMDGLGVLKTIRARDDGTPTLLLTARSSTAERVAGLDLGADDYLVKPFEMDELEARIRALLRRRDQVYLSHESIGPLQFDRAGRIAKINEEVLDLPRRELAVLECLLSHKDQIVGKQQLLDHTYGVGADVESTAVEPHISRLRQRLAPYNITIKTARGLGYMIVAES
ncbi:MAG: response regulator transcription factor [Gammaproteobacteria bacterium]|nr:response regulator transcription factor [Gammaproteobacteria bacterium]